MTEQLKAWWAARTTREQRLLIVMFALLGVVVVWLGVVRPVSDALAGARERHAAAVTRLAEAHAAAEAYQAYRRAGAPPLPAPVATVVAQAATEAGFTTSAVSPVGANQVNVTLPSARPVALFSWLQALEGRGVVVDRFSARTNADQTLAVELTLRGRGG